MQSPDVRNGDYCPFFGGMIPSSFWRVHLRRLMDAISIVIVKIPGQDPPEVRITEDDDSVEAFSANAAV